MSAVRFASRASRASSAQEIDGPVEQKAQASS